MTTTLPGKSGASALPPHANLEHLKKQAKQLLQAFRAGDADALQSIANLYPKPEVFSGLRDAQLVIARKYGCQDWEQLAQTVDMQKLMAANLREQADQFVALACLRYSGDDRAWRYEHAAALLAKVPQLVDVNLACALVAGNLAAVKRQLDKTPPLATQTGGPLNWPPLMYLTYSRIRSSKEDVLGILHLLLGLGADPDSHVMFNGLYRFSAVTGAMGEGERGPIDCPPHPFADTLVDALLAAGATPNEFQGLYNTMFTDSLDRWLPQLIAHGLNAAHTTDPDKPDAETTFDFVLSAAVGYGRLKRIEILLGAGANPNAVSRYNGRSAHTNAALAGQPDIAAVLLQHGAKVQKLSADDNFRVACWQGDLVRADTLLKENPGLARDAQVFADVARAGGLFVPWLIEHGFDINCQTPDGRTVLHRIAAGNELEEVKAMLALGADPNLAEHHYRGTPMGFALHNRAWDVVHYLKELSDNVFDLACVMHTARLVLLLKNDPTLVARTTPMGNTPLHVVGRATDADIDVTAAADVIHLLLRYGADPLAKNNEGLTPVQFHRKMGNDEVADLLVAATK